MLWGSPADRVWSAGALLGTLAGMAAVAAIFRPPAAVLVLAGLACAAASRLPAPATRLAVSPPAAPPPRRVEFVSHTERKSPAVGVSRPAEPAVPAEPVPADRLAALNQGERLQSQGRLDEAIGCFRRAAEGTDSLAATAALSLGVVLASRGDQRAAAAAYEHAVGCGGGAAESAALLLRWLRREREAA